MNREDVAMDLTFENLDILRKEVQAAKLLLSECNEIFSEEDISNIELRGYLSGKLSADEVIELLAPPAEQRNQCDGCQAGIPVDENGSHRMGRAGGYPDLMHCQKERYEHHEQAEGAQGEVHQALATYARVYGRHIVLEGVSEHQDQYVRGCQASAALAQPSPAEDMSAAQELAGVKAILNDMADALKRLTFHARTTGGTAGPDAALMNACERAERILSLGGMGAAFMRGCDEHESQPSPAPELELERGTVYVEARRCSGCGHAGVNDGADGLSACGHCEWTGPQPSKDECPDCLRQNCMSVACPECGGRYELVAEANVAAPVSQAGQVPEGYMVLQTASLSHVLGLVEGAMEDAYGNAFQVCCGKGSGGECCGDPEAGWSPEDQRTMDVLNPIQRELRAMLDATPAQGGDA